MILWKLNTQEQLLFSTMKDLDSGVKIARSNTATDVTIRNQEIVFNANKDMDSLKTKNVNWQLMALFKKVEML